MNAGGKQRDMFFMFEITFLKAAYVILAGKLFFAT